MILLALLAALLVGAALGARGFHAMGRRLRGPWRPGLGVLALLSALAGLLLLARAEWLPGALLLGLSGVLGTIARRRAALAAPARTGLGRREAAALLGVAVDASPNVVEEAYRRLIRRTHPDAGGTAGLAAQLNAARAVMLGRS